MPESNGSNIGSGDVAGLLAFLDWVVNKKLATPAAISPLKSATKQIFLTVENQGEIDGIDVRSLDQEDYFSRFQVAAQASGRFTPDSVRAYRNRFTRALQLYNDYLTTGDTPKIATRGAATVRTRKETPTSSPPPASPAKEPVEAVEAGSVGSMISYPFPLENGELANLRLPKRLEARDAARLASFINALIFEPQKQLSRASAETTTETPSI